MTALSSEELFSRSVAEIIDRRSLMARLSGKKKLRIKFGIDPTAPDIHLGHAVAIRKLRQFQERGHTIVFIVGSATALIGDPSGRSTTRPPLTAAQIAANAATYFKQAGKILDLKRTEVHKNSRWLGKLRFADIIRLAGTVTFAQMMAHETFRKRVEEDRTALRLHELLYPLAQGYDSVAVRADVEVGGLDQKFNLLMGRELQKHYGQKPQDIVLTEYLIGTDGKAKMSKSFGNYIALTDSPSEMYGKVMSIPDELTWHYFELATDVPLKEIAAMKRAAKGGSARRAAKAKLARTLVAEYHNAAAADQAAAAFDAQFHDKKLPQDIPTVSLKGSFELAALLVRVRLAPSKSEARRLVAQGGVKLDGVRADNPAQGVTAKKDLLIQVGKRRFIRIK